MDTSLEPNPFTSPVPDAPETTASTDTTATQASTQDAADVATAMPRWLAALMASSAYLVPMLLSRSSSPTPNHPRVLLWYKSLRQPAFKPPDIAIPIAWGLIESGLAMAGYRLLRRPDAPERDRALGWLGLNVVAIGAWSRLFFKRRDLPLSTVAAATMVVAAGAYVVEAKKADRVAAAAGVPLVAWLAFATVLTAAIWRRNR